MTTPDFAKLAAECTANYRDFGAAWDVVEENIRAALVGVWDLALEAAAVEADKLTDSPSDHEAGAAGNIADAVRKRKIVA